MADSRTIRTSSASSSPGWAWVRRIGLFGLAYSLTAMLMLVLPSLIGYYIRPAFQMAAAAGVSLMLWVWFRPVRPLAAGILAGAATYTVFIYWVLFQVSQRVTA